MTGDLSSRLSFGTLRERAGSRKEDLPHATLHKSGDPPTQVAPIGGDRCVLSFVQKSNKISILCIAINSL